ncbi:IS1 family transposase [Escherichia coli]
MYGTVFQVLQWLLFLISCPSCSATDGVVRNGKHRRTSALSLLSLP